MKIVLIAALVIAAAKWFIYRVSLLAVLLYFAECGQELPDQETIRKYQAKVIVKLLGINLQFGIDTFDGLMAMLYRQLWSKAEMREVLLDISKIYDITEFI